MAGGARQATKADKVIGQRIRDKRVERGLTQDELAEVLEVTYQQVQKYETGFTRVAASRLCDIARELDCSPLDLLPPDCPGGDSEVAKLMATPNALAVARGFSRLSDPEQQRAVINLIKSLAMGPLTRKKR